MGIVLKQKTKVWKPSHCKAHNNLGFLAGRAQEWDEALSEFPPRYPFVLMIYSPTLEQGEIRTSRDSTKKRSTIMSVCCIWTQHLTKQRMLKDTTSSRGSAHLKADTAHFPIPRMIEHSLRPAAYTINRQTHNRFGTKINPAMLFMRRCKSSWERSVSVSRFASRSNGFFTDIWEENCLWYRFQASLLGLKTAHNQPQLSAKTMLFCASSHFLLVPPNHVG